MDAVHAFGVLADLDGLIGIVRAQIAALPMSVLGWPVAPALYPALVFAPLVLWAAVLRGVALVVALAVLAWIASIALLQADVPAVGAFQFLAAWAAGFLLCMAARGNRLRNLRLGKSVEEKDRKLTAATFELDRERLWRRASGDDRSTLDDAVFRDLMDRLRKDSTLNEPTT